MTITDIMASAASQTGSFRKALKMVLMEECEFQHDGETIRTEKVPFDTGGITFAGIDRASHPDFPFDHPQPYHVWQTYLDNYYRPLRCSEMPSAIGILVFCQGVNQGVGTAGRLLQFALNDYGCHLTVDGKIGEQTLKAIWSQPDTTAIGMAFLAKSRKHYADIVEKNPSQQRFLMGWNSRIDGLKREVLNA